MRNASGHNYRNSSVTVVLAMEQNVPQNEFVVITKFKKTKNKYFS